MCTGRPADPTTSCHCSCTDPSAECCAIIPSYASITAVQVRSHAGHSRHKIDWPGPERACKLANLQHERVVLSGWHDPQDGLAMMTCLIWAAAGAFRATLFTVSWLCIKAQTFGWSEDAPFWELTARDHVLLPFP